MLSILTAFTLLFSFAASARPVLAEYPPDTDTVRPTVNGLFYGDGDGENFYGTPHLYGLYSDTRLYRFVDPPNTPGRRLFVAMVVDGNLNDNVFDALPTTVYMESAGWAGRDNYRTAKSLMDSEYAQFSVKICSGEVITWSQGYAQQFEPGIGGAAIGVPNSVIGQAGWVSDEEIDTGVPFAPFAPAGYESSSSIVWNLNNYAEAITKTFDMGVNCYISGDPVVTPTVPCDIDLWKSPFHPFPAAGDTVTTTGGWPETITTTTPISFSIPYEWEWAMVYEWSVLVPEGPECMPDDILITTGSVHHSPSKTGLSYDPTPVTLIELAASTTAALLPIAGLLVGVSGVIVAPRRRRRRD